MLMKMCRTCTTMKARADFGKRLASLDGLAHKCKDCQKSYDKVRLRDPKRMQARRDYQKTDKGKDAHNRANKVWISRNEIKRAANTIVSNAIRGKRLIRASHCQECPSADRLEGHHDDYALPLIVRWLCNKCHNDWHNENGEGLNAN